jgi:hypothetical protein
MENSRVPEYTIPKCKKDTQPSQTCSGGLTLYLLLNYTGMFELELALIQTQE